MRLGASILIWLLAAASCLAGETVYLTSGFSVLADSHTIADGMYVLQVGSGTIEYPADQIVEIVPSAGTDIFPAVPEKRVALKPDAILKNAAETEGVDEIFVRAVARVESGLRQEAVSRKGALGLMQLMPATAAELGVDPKQADQNASGGARYLRFLLERYHYNPALALAAYNAGPGAVTKYRGLPPYYETRAYVVRVLREYEKQLKIAGIQPNAAQFAKTRDNGTVAAAKMPSATN